jgi:hypothetical protein
MRNTIQQPQTITAPQMRIAASNWPGDWRAKKYERKRIREYAFLNRKFLESLGAEITKVQN